MKHYLPQIETIIKRAAEPLREPFGNITPTHKKEADAASVVTELDISTEIFIKAELASLLPDISFVGEETGGDRTAERFWLLDPIDGTALFVRGIPFCTIMLALIEAGEPTLGCVYNFMTDEMFSATKNGGATCNGEPIHVSDRPLEDAYIGFECRLESDEDRNMYMRLNGKTGFFQSMNAGYEMAMVACGKLDGRVMLHPFGKDYDFTPGALLIKEAGGMVANIGSPDYNYTNLNILAVNPTIFAELTTGASPLFPINA